LNCVDAVDRGNDNWLVKYEKSATGESHPEVVAIHIKETRQFYAAHVADLSDSGNLLNLG